MDDIKLDDYMKQVVSTLETNKYSEHDIRKSLDKLVFRSKNKVFFLMLYYMYSLFLGIISATLVFLAGTLIAGSLPYILAVIVLALVGYMLFFEFKYFDFDNKNILLFTAPISIIVSLFVLVIGGIVKAKLVELNSQMASLSSAQAAGGAAVLPLSFFGTGMSQTNLYLLVVLIILMYNVLPIFFWIKEKE